MSLHPLNKILLAMMSTQARLCEKHKVEPTRVGMALLRTISKALTVCNVPADLIITEVGSGIQEGRDHVTKITELPAPPLNS